MRQTTVTIPSTFPHTRHHRVGVNRKGVSLGSVLSSRSFPLYRAVTYTQVHRIHVLLCSLITGTSSSPLSFSSRFVGIPHAMYLLLLPHHLLRPVSRHTWTQNGVLNESTTHHPQPPLPSFPLIAFLSFLSSFLRDD